MRVGADWMSAERPAHKMLLGSLVITTSYAILRYNLLKGVPWEELPVYILNKSISWSSVILFLGAAWRARRSGAPVWMQEHFRQAFALATCHMLLTLPILDSVNYPKLYSGLKLNAAGGMSVLAGVLSMMAFVVWNRGHQGRWFGLWVIPVLLGAHLLPLGVDNWVTPSNWPGGMPPITLLSFLACLVALGLLRGVPTRPDSR